MAYSLSGADAALFTITSDTIEEDDLGRGGQIAVKAGTKLDYETKKKSYMVTVKATDPGDLSASIDVTIKVTNVDEAPEEVTGDARKDYPENGTGQVAIGTGRRTLRGGRSTGRY